MSPEEQERLCCQRVQELEAARASQREARYEDAQGDAE
jgi:hypothetical protein